MSQKSEGWIGVDLDGTLAEYHGWKDDSIGKPIPRMLKRVVEWMDSGREVRIVTARVADSRACVKNIEDWCEKNIGYVLPVTCKKDMNMLELWDDRAVQVIKNTGRRADGKA